MSQTELGLGTEKLIDAREKADNGTLMLALKKAEKDLLWELEVNFEYDQTKVDILARRLWQMHRIISGPKEGREIPAAPGPDPFWENPETRI